MEMVSKNRTFFAFCLSKLFSSSFTISKNKRRENYVSDPAQSHPGIRIKDGTSPSIKKRTEISGTGSQKYGRTAAAVSALFHGTVSLYRASCNDQKLHSGGMLKSHYEKAFR